MRKLAYMTKSNKTSVITSIILIAVYVIFFIILKTSFPSGQELVKHFANVYSKYGYEIVFIGSLLESLIVINLFVPGILAVGLGIIFTRTGQLELDITILVAVIGALISYALDFVLGRFGFGEIVEKIGYGEAIRKAEGQIEKYGLRSFSLGFIHPDIGSFVSLAAGIVKVPFKKFIILATLATCAWYILWGLLIFALGKIFLTILTKYAFILFILVLVIWLLIFVYGKTKED